MMNKVLWVLDNETSPKTFERLCVDLLFRNGYANIIPVGGVHDRGRDAESRGIQGTDSAGQMTFFQFSLQKNWKQKLRSELQKVSLEGHQISAFVFLTNQEVSGRDRDRFEQEAKHTYAWDLTILSREWLRLQLEESNPDIAQRHLGIQLPEPRQRFEVPFEFDEPKSGDARKAWRLFNDGDYERAAVEIRDYLKRHANIAVAWEALAWSQYELFRYDEALASINRALEIAPSSRQTISIRGCILAEKGIHQGDRESIREANKIFASLIPDPRGVTHYNYGNTLSALSQFGEAAAQYKIAVEITPGDPRIWKNLATVYHELGEHEKEMECFDRAIEIDPKQPQALFSKGVSLLIDFGKAEESIELMQEAFEVSNDLPIRWPHIWYWLGEAHRRVKKFDEALSWVEKGLRQAPGNMWLRRLRFEIVAEEWKTQAGKIEYALEFFGATLKDNPLDFSVRLELVKIYAADGRSDEAWRVLQGSFSALNVTLNTQLSDSGFSIEECSTALEHLPAYLAFRRSHPVDMYWDISDPVYLLREAPPPNHEFEDSLMVYCSIPFGKARNKLAQRASSEAPSPDVSEIFSAMRSDLERAIPKAAGAFTRWIEDDSTGVRTLKKLATSILFSPVVALREWGKQHGWLATTFDIPEDSREQAIQAMVEADMDRTVTGATLEQLLSDALREKIKQEER